MTALILGLAAMLAGCIVFAVLVTSADRAQRAADLRRDRHRPDLHHARRDWPHIQIRQARAHVRPGGGE